MSETITEERRVIPGFPSYLITRDGHIYSPGGKELYRPTNVEMDTVLLLRQVGDEIAEIRSVAGLIRRTYA